jgi:hypothetical protein
MTATIPAGMTNHAAALAALGHDYAAQYKLMTETEEAARAAATLVGRFYKRQVADGYANYEVCLVNGNRAYLRHVDVGDGYRDSSMEGLSDDVGDPFDPKGTLFAVKLAFVQDNIERQDRLAALFARKA